MLAAVIVAIYCDIENIIIISQRATLVFIVSGHLPNVSPVFGRSGLVSTTLAAKLLGSPAH